MAKERWQWLAGRGGGAPGGRLQIEPGHRDRRALAQPRPLKPPAQPKLGHAYRPLYCTLIEACMVLDGSDASAKAAIHTSGSARPRSGRMTAVRRCRGVSANGDVDSLAVLRGSEHTVPMSAEAVCGDDGMLGPQTHVSRSWMQPTGKRYPDPQTHVSGLVSPYA